MTLHKVIIAICFLSTSFVVSTNSIEASQVDVGIASPINIKDGKCTIVYGTTYLKADSFARTKSLLNYVYLPSTLKRIDASTFAGSNLKKFDIPLGIMQIPPRCFAECKNLTHVNCMQSDMFSLERIGMAAFINDTQLVKVILPETVKVIAERCFSGCTNLRTLLIPSTIKSIDSNAFKNVKLKTCLIFTPKNDRRSQNQKITAMRNDLTAAGADVSECIFSFVTYQTDGCFVNPDCSTAQKELIDMEINKLSDTCASVVANRLLPQRLNQPHWGEILNADMTLSKNIAKGILDEVNELLHKKFDLAQWGNCAYIEDWYLNKQSLYRPLNNNISRFTKNSLSAVSKTDERTDLLKKVDRLIRCLKESVLNEDQKYFDEVANFLNDNSLLNGPIDGIKGAIQYVQKTLNKTFVITTKQGKAKIAEFNELIEVLFDNFNNRHFTTPSFSNASNVSQNASAKPTVSSSASNISETEEWANLLNKGNRMKRFLEERADLLKNVAKLRGFLSKSLSNEDQRYFNQAADFLNNDSLLSGPIDGIKEAIQYVQKTLNETTLINSEQGKAKIAEFNTLIETLFDNFGNKHFTVPNLSNASNIPQNTPAKPTVRSNISNISKTDERAALLKKVARLRRFLNESLPNEDQGYFNEAAEFLNKDSLLSGPIDGIKGAIQYVQETLKKTPLIKSERGKMKIAEFNALIEALFKPL